MPNRSACSVDLSTRCFVSIQKDFKEHGMSKSVVILDSGIAVLQLKRTAKESGIYDHERYLTPEDNPNWEKQAMDWLLNDIDPDKQYIVNYLIMIRIVFFDFALYGFFLVCFVSR